MKFYMMVAAFCALPLSAMGATGDTTKAKPVVSIVMPPDSYDYKKAPGQQVAQTYCLTCHSSAYVSMQPPMDAAQWAKEVTKMRKAYGAQMSDEDASKVADYLGKAYGPASP
ncbi:MAG: cytochrome c [Candidatus Eremiobacteraeota bacterium]|nr:cytochrome c [Candidatus Eremiobacteraeota bacterium]